MILFQELLTDALTKSFCFFPDVAGGRVLVEEETLLAVAEEGAT